MNRTLKRCLWAAGGCVTTVALIVGGYAVYLEATYSRIPDHQELEIVAAEEWLAEDTATEQPLASAPAQTDTEYTAITYNVGFGAYTPDFSFFMDTGEMLDGTRTRGKSGTAESEESVRAATQGAIDAVLQQDPDVVLFQEIDVDSDRSHHVNQVAMAREALPAMTSTFGVNFHSAYLAAPPWDPHGRSLSGLATHSTLPISSAERRSFPISQAFPDKLFDLDRCFTVQRIPTADGKELVVINSHMSAYDDGSSKDQQLDMLRETMTAESEAGNYVILGGDWNHILFDSEDFYPTQQKVPETVVSLSDDMLPDGFRLVRPDNVADVATCRGADLPYQAGVNFTQTIDGFIVSSNVAASASNVDTGFSYSDHNPVQLEFSLQS